MDETSDQIKQKARNSIFRLLKIRIRSRKELIDHLTRKGFSQSIIESTIEYFTDIDMVNDQLFAKQWIASRLNKPYGSRRISIELARKGVSKDIIKDELQNATQHYNEVAVVCKLAKHRAELYNNVEDQKIKQRIYGYLARRGFSSEAIYKAIKEL